LTVQWTEVALVHLEAVRRYIQGDSLRAAAATVKKVRQSALILQAHPEAGRIGRVFGTRELVVAGTPYILPCQIVDGTIEILAVLHGAQEWPESF
jgi:plasmid stabilization system protein ParE